MENCSVADFPMQNSLTKPGLEYSSAWAQVTAEMVKLYDAETASVKTSVLPVVLLLLRRQQRVLCILMGQAAEKHPSDRAGDRLPNEFSDTDVEIAPEIAAHTRHSQVLLVKEHRLCLGALWHFKK